VRKAQVLPLMAWARQGWPDFVCAMHAVIWSPLV
jgi:hypothetical protein